MLAHEVIDLSCHVAVGEPVLGGPVLFEGLSLSLVPGKINQIRGKSGAGKSSLLRALAGSLTTSGAVSVSGRMVWHGVEPGRRPRIAWMNQEPRLQVLMPTVESELAFSLTRANSESKHSQQEIGSRVRQVAANYGISHLMSRKLATLSSGELQRVVLASLIVTEPEVLLLDEPFSHQSDSARARLGERLALDVARMRIAALISDHECDEYGWVARTFDIGRQESVGETARYSSVSVPASSGDKSAAATLVECSQVECLFTNGSESLSLFEPCSFSVRAGEVVVLSGENGVGKTTLLQLIARGAPPSYGQSYGLQYRGELVVHDRIRRSYLSAELRQYLFADTVEEEIQGGLPELNASREQFLADFGLAAKRLVSPSALSVGERQRLVLALLLAERPQLLLLDEPTRGLDAASRRRLSEILRHVVGERESGVIIATHDRHLIENLGAREVRLETSHQRVEAWCH